MKFVLYFILFALLTKYSYERLLGGWSTSTDESLIQECLRKALIHITGDQVNNRVQSEASNVVCKTQIVNGLNIKLQFDFRQETWKCSFYKSFIRTLHAQLEDCERINKKQLPEENIVKSNPEQRMLQNEPDDDDEAKIDALNQPAREENVHRNDQNIGENNQQKLEGNVDQDAINNDVDNPEIPNRDTNIDDDDEGKINQNNQQVQEEDMDHDQVKIETNNQQIPDDN